MNLPALKSNKTIIISLAALVSFFIIIILSTQKRSPKRSVKESTSDIGVSIGGIDQQAYIARLEKNYYDFEDRVKEMEKKVSGMHLMAEQIKNSQSEVEKAVEKLDQSWSAKMNEKLDELKKEGKLNDAKDNSLVSDVELSIANIKPLEENWVYLPLGSFCKGTLITGVYAAADVNNPLPVLISLDEAFYGPNQSRIPLKGAFVLGKAYGDLVSERALIQIVAISTVLPNGHTFENEQDLGYVTDEMGELGIKGKVVYNTGRQLAMSFMGGFVAGGSQSIADSQVVTHQNNRGETTRTTTGSSAKNSLFSGVAQSAGKLAQFYEKQAEEMVPAVHINNGATIYFIVQKGVTIHGLAASDFDHKRFMD